MTILTEGDLQLTLPAIAHARKFDDNTTHGLSHCMKAVDFIIELADRILFVEIKDPDAPNAPKTNRDTYIQEFLSGRFDADLKTKCRDTWLYEWAQGRAKKPITYVVLMGAQTLTSADLLRRTDALKRALPLMGPANQAWKNPFITGCAVMNLAAWNSTMPAFAVTRRSQTPTTKTKIINSKK
jgi:hypothetical protein